MRRFAITALVPFVVVACVATPSVQLVIDDADAGVSPSSSSNGDDAGSPVTGDDAALATGDDSSSPVQGGAGGDAASDANACIMPKGQSGKCCGAIACIGDHCNAGPACDACAACAGHAYCCTHGNDPVQCIDDANQCN